MDKIKSKLARTVADIRASLGAVKEWFKRLMNAADAADKALDQIGKGIEALKIAETTAKQDVIAAEKKGAAVADAYLAAWSKVSAERDAADQRSRRCLALLRKYDA